MQYDRSVAATQYVFALPSQPKIAHPNFLQSRRLSLIRTWWPAFMSHTLVSTTCIHSGSRFRRIERLFPRAIRKYLKLLLVAMSNAFNPQNYTSPSSHWSPQIAQLRASSSSTTGHGGRLESGNDGSSSPGQLFQYQSGWNDIHPYFQHLQDQPTPEIANANV